MTATLQVTQLDQGASAAAQVLAPTLNIGLGVPTSIAGNTYLDSSVYGGDSVSATAAYVGFRRAISIDLSSRKYIQFQMVHANLSRTTLATWANGGIRLVFEDASGAVAGFNIFGSDWDNTGIGSLGYFSNGNSMASINSLQWQIEKTRTPDYVSGSINWATVIAYEVHFNPLSSGRRQLAIGRIRTVDEPIVTGASSTFAQIQAAWAATTSGNYSYQFSFKNLPDYARGLPFLTYAPQIGFQIGDGATTTSITQSNFGFGFFNPPENTAIGASPLYAGTGPYVLLSTNRLCDIFQSATDSVTLTDGVWASSSRWGATVRGSSSGTCTFTRNSFFRHAQFACGHGTFTDCIWDGHTAAIDCAANTTITRGTVRNGTNGIKITGAAGTYAQSITFSNQSVYDIECGSGGAGTYTLSNIAVVGAYTLKIRNDSATNAVTVAIPAGIAYTTSTAGGTIAVSTPATYQSVTVNGLVSGSRLQIYDATSSAELANVTTGTSYTWTDANPAVSSRDIRVRIAYQTGVTAKVFIEAAIGTAGTSGSNAAVTYLANQTDDTTYNSNAIDGSAVTGITFTDSAVDTVNCNIAGGSVTWPTIYAAFVYWNFTATGIANDFTYVSAPDTANYLLSSMKVKNTSAGIPLSVTGGYGRDATTGLSSTIIDTTGGFIFLAPDHVVPFATGSGVTAGDKTDIAAAVLSAAASTPIAADIRKVNSLTISGAGTSESPWGP